MTCVSETTVCHQLIGHVNKFQFLMHSTIENTGYKIVNVGQRAGGRSRKYIVTVFSATADHSLLSYIVGFVSCLSDIYFLITDLVDFKSISTDFYSLFNCCFVTPLSPVRGRVEISLTGLTPPHTLCACPNPGTCSPVGVFVRLFIVIRFTLSQ